MHNMMYSIKMISQDSPVIESFWIEVDELLVNVFCAEYNFRFEMNHEYQVELEFKIFDEYQVFESNLPAQLRKIDKSFSYEVIGVLENGMITIGDFKVFDEILLSDYGYLEGKNICWRVDRIDMSID